MAEESERRVGVDLGLSPEEKEELRRIARNAIERRLKRDVSAASTRPLSDKLKEKRGAFVTLYKRGMLRGCIGLLEASAPLHETVAEMACAAAFEDSRFRPVEEEELPYLDIEISALTPLEEIHDPDRIEVGRHGLLVEKGLRSGLLLPQVAAERNWDRITFLEETCRKAGLHKNAWKDDDTKIYVFSADVF